MPEQKEQVPRQSSGMMGFYFIFMMLSFFIILSPQIREGIAYGVGFIFYPVFGFSGTLPVLTIIFSGVIITIINTYSRHYFADWIKFGKVQNKMKAIQKKSREAMKTRDMAKINQYRKLQQKMMPEQMEMMNAQMKPTMVTMFIVIAIFTWLYVFLGGYKTIYPIPITKVTLFNVPWASNIRFNAYYFIIPYWMILSSFFTAVFSQVMTYSFKMYEFTKRLKSL